jgi:hypothetical protein
MTSTHKHTKMYFTILAFIAAIGVAGAADKPTDLTGVDAGQFKAHLGQTVVLRGRLEEGKEGSCLWGATPTNVVFYIIPDMSKSGPVPIPETWTHFEHQQVRITGELKFRSFDQIKAGLFNQPAPDYYFMVLQRTKIESDSR